MWRLGCLQPTQFFLARVRHDGPVRDARAVRLRASREVDDCSRDETPLKPLVAALLGIAAPVAGRGLGHVHGQILVNDPSGATTVTLLPGDSAAYAYDGTNNGTLNVSGLAIASSPTA